MTTLDAYMEKATRAIDAGYAKARDTSFLNLIAAGKDPNDADYLLHELDADNAEHREIAILEVRAWLIDECGVTDAERHPR